VALPVGGKDDRARPGAGAASLPRPPRSRTRRPGIVFPQWCHRGDSLPPDGTFEGKRGRSRPTAMRQMPVIASLADTSLADTSFADTSFAHLLQVTRHGLKKIQYQPGLIDGCLAETGLTLETGATDITN
jgi:hypothetical protein